MKIAETKANAEIPEIAEQFPLGKLRDLCDLCVIERLRVLRSRRYGCPDSSLPATAPSATGRSTVEDRRDEG